MKYLVFSLVALIPLSFAHAVTPSVASFSASPTSINSGYTVTFSWSVQDASGYSFSIPCIEGIVLKNINSSSFSCGNSLSSYTSNSGYVSLVIVNVSGGTRTLTAHITPKDSSGQDYTASRQSITLTVATAPYPLTTFTSSASKTSPGSPITVSWTALAELTAVNIKIPCSDAIKVTSPSYPGGYLPCETPIFTNGLYSSSSLTLNFTNTSAEPLPYRLTLLPAISSNSYDATHALTLDLTVASDVTPDPSITYFNAPQTVLSGKPVDISWSIANAKGANLQIICSPYITATTTPTPQQTIPCNTPAFQNALAATGTTTLGFKNSDAFAQTISIILLPSKTIGQYDATRSKTISLLVQSAINPPAPSSLPIQSTPSTPTFTPGQAQKTPIFLKSLGVGSRGADVITLQTFLAKDPTLYPEKSITGYYGPATARAIGRFQLRYNLTTLGGPGYGNVGPKTRAKLNELR